MKKLLVILLVSWAANVMAEEISVPDINLASPQKSIDSGAPGNIANNAAQVSRPIVYNSLFFNKDTAAMLESAHESYKRILQKRDAGKLDTAEIAANGVPKENLIKQIYISSIIYKNSKDVAVWINSVKYKVGETINDITLVSASAEKARVRFSLINHMISDASNAALTKNANVRLDADANTLEFSLAPNQRLDLEQMKILAGNKVYTNTNADLDKFNSDVSKFIGDMKKTGDTASKMKNELEGINSVISNKDKLMEGFDEVARLADEISAIKDPISKPIIDKAMQSKDDAGMQKAIEELKAAGKADDATKLQKFYDVSKKMEAQASSIKDKNQKN